MAPKAAAHAAESRQLRSASKAPLQSPSSSKAAKVVGVSKTSSSKAVSSATTASKPQAKGGFTTAAPRLVSGGSKSSKTSSTKDSQSQVENSDSNIGAKRSSNVLSPMIPKNLSKTQNGSQSPHHSNVADGADGPEMPVISQVNHSALYTMIMLKVSNFNRFSAKWNELQISGDDIIYSYSPATFLDDFTRDLSTSSAPMDRPTAARVFKSIMSYIDKDESIQFAKRQEWMIAFCDQFGAQLPPEYASAPSQNLSSSSVHASKRPHVDANDNDGNDDNDEDDAFSAVQSQAVLNAFTVWGSKSGFAIVPHEEILKMHKKKAEEITKSNINSAKAATVTYPKLKTWSKGAWLTFDRQWWNCVVEAVQNGVYQSMISLIDLDIVNDVQIDLDISPENWYSMSEIDFIRKAHGHFGPSNKEEALLLLKQEQCIVYSGQIKPDVFLSVLSKYNTNFLRALDLQIAPSIRKWPQKGKPKYGPLTVKSVRKAFKDGFASCKDKSVACKHCFNVCEQNPTMSHKELYTELRVHFQDDAKALERETMHGGSAAKPKPQDIPRDRQANGGRVERQGQRPENKNRQNQRPKSDGERKFKVVLGKDRCVYCGDYNNHYGHGAKFCHIKGTEHAKPASYKWKNSDEEPKVALSNKEFAAIKKAKPDMFTQTAIHRAEYRSKFSSKSENYSSSAADVALVAIEAAHSQDTATNLVSHVGTPISSVPLARSLLVDIVQMGQRFSAAENAMSLEDMGYSERFFGTARFWPAQARQSLPTSRDVQLCINRDIQAGRYRRSPRHLDIHISDSDDFNSISSTALSNESKFGRLKILEERITGDAATDPRRSVLLECFIQHRHDRNEPVVFREWFTVDQSQSLSPDVVVVSQAFAFDQDITGADSSNTHRASANTTGSSVVGRVFFDTGAQMSCISKHLVKDALCLDTANVNITVMQGIHFAGTVDKAVRLAFDLFDKDMKPTRNEAWFIVWDNPYGIILGDSVCEQFTTWKQNLASWSSAESKAMFDVPLAFTSWIVVTPKQQSDSGSESERSSPGKRNRRDVSQLQSKHPVTGASLRFRNAGNRPVVQSLDHKNYIPFNGLRPAGLLQESARRAEQNANCMMKEKRLNTLLKSLPKNDRVSFDTAEMQNNFAKDQVGMCLQIMHDIAGLPVGLMIGSGAGAVVRRAELFEPVCLASSISAVTPEVAKRSSAELYLLHKADAKTWTWDDEDEKHYVDLLANPTIPPPTIQATPLSEIQKFTVQWLTAATIKCCSTGKSVAWTAEQDNVVRNITKRLAEKETKPLPPTPTLESSAANDVPLAVGRIVQFHSCTRLPEFNGKLGRLYCKCSDDDDRWQIRVLGRNHGQFVTSSTKNFSLHSEQKSFVSSAHANYHDVGIDDSGMPIESNVDAPKPVHRQFGREYSAELTRRIKEVLAKYPQLFDGDISTPCTFEEMDIKLKPNAILPAKARYYRNTPMMREEVRRQIQEQLDAGVISKEPTAVVSNILMVKRPHMPGRYRFVVDYRQVNEATVPDVLLMPDVKSQHDRLANKCIFGAVDISSYYRLIKLKKDCRYLTGFATEDGTYVYNRVPMGVRNACSHAQRALQEKLAADPILGINGANIRNYFDDIAWGSTTEDEFIIVLTALMDFAVEHKLKYNIEKSCFGVDSITHVGFIADKNGIRIDPERTKDIVDMQAPKSTKKVQSVLGVFNFVRNFIPNFSIKAKFLTDRLEKSAVKRDVGKKFVWTASDEVAFAELKSLVLAAPLLSVLDYSSDIYIRCDSSRFGAGAVLFQYDAEGREMPVCYASRKYTATETRYSTFQQEMGCVVWALERFQEYTLGYKVIVETDHRNISFVKRSAMPQLARWRMRLEAFDFDVHYRCGAMQQVADGLSRSACDEPGVDDVAVYYHDVLPECALSNAAPATSATLVNVDSVEYIDFTELDDVEPSISIDFSPIDVADDEEIQDDSEASQVPQLPWNDAAAVKSIIESVHNDIAGHGGVLVTLQRLLRKGRPTVSRKQMLADIDNYLKGCVGCQKMRKRSSSSAITRRVISGSPFSDLSIDILKLPFPDAYGNLFAVVIIDNFSHWMTLYACANKSAICAARALLHFIGTFGAPLRIRSDGGGEFVNDIVTQLATMLDCKQIVVQPYLHTANGIVERVNRSVLEKLRYILFDRRIKRQPKLQWTDLLPLAQRILNASTHSAIGTSPARLIFGDHLDLDRCILSSAPKATVDKPVPDYVDQLSAQQLALMEAANDYQVNVQTKIIAKAQQANADKPIKQLQIGDLVLVKPLSDFPHDKLAPSHLGPLYVVDLLDGGLVELRHPHSNKLSVVSDFQCELFNQSLISSIEGLKAVAETDGFEFAVDGILAHGLLTDNDDVDPTPLPASHVRRSHAKNYAFLIKWTGYETPTWIAYKAARRLPHFENYISSFPNLKMGNHR